MTWPRATRGIPNNKRNQDRETFSTVVEGNWLWNMGKREGDVKYLQWFLRGERSWFSHRKCWGMGRQLRERKACDGLKFHLELLVSLLSRGMSSFSPIQPRGMSSFFPIQPVSLRSRKLLCLLTQLLLVWQGQSHNSWDKTPNYPNQQQVVKLFLFFFLLSHENQPYIHMQLASPCSKITLSLLIISSGLHWTSVT